MAQSVELDEPRVGEQTTLDRLGCLSCSCSISRRWRDSGGSYCGSWGRS